MAAGGIGLCGDALCDAWRARRVLAMVARMDEEGFGNCSWHGECQAACPKSISIDTIAHMNRDWLRACRHLCLAEGCAPGGGRNN